MVFNFNIPKTASGFTLPTTSAPTSTSSGGAGDTKQQTKSVGGLFGTTNTFSFSAATTKTVAPSLISSTTTVATKPTFGIAGAVSSASTPQFTLSASTTTTPSTFTPIGAGISLATTPLAVSQSLKLTPSLPVASTTTTVTPAGSVSLSLVTTTTGTVATPSTTTSVTCVLPTTSTLTYAQLEDSINKWTIDLEEQGKFFINQAKQLNAWDNLLVSNGDKILNLNEMIEKVKDEQKQLDQELDFVLAQQNELDELSLPLEKQLSEIPVTDQNRFQMYQMSEIIDSQMKQMSEDLKEIIDHLNESNKNEDISDPITQISRILNAHMNSLQWIDRNTTEISSHLDQITKMHDVYRKNHLNL